MHLKFNKTIYRITDFGFEKVVSGGLTLTKKYDWNFIISAIANNNMSRSNKWQILTEEEMFLECI